MSHAVCFVTAELAPLVKAGGLGDVAAALTGLLHRGGHRVLPVLPLYSGLARQGLTVEAIDGLADLALQFGPHRFGYSVLRARRGGGLPDVMLVDCPPLFDRPGVYGSADDEHLRFLLLARAALETCQRLGFAPDILHCHDWHTALLPLYLRTVYAWDRLFTATRSVLTIHNLGYQGILPATAAAELGLGDAVRELDARELAGGRINLLGQGIRDADAVSTVSPGYAREICTPEYGMQLDGILRARGEPVTGILNGVDYALWDPATDRLIPHRYSAHDFAGKARMRAALAARLGLTASRAPLIGMVTRLAWHKGIELLFDVLPEALASGRMSVAVLGQGEPRYEKFFAGLAAAHPGRAAFVRGHDEPLAHWIEAGSDAFLMPSLYEPCGLNQMYSLRYGTVPIVRRTGGLADSVERFDAASGAGNGIVFDEATPAAVRAALEEAATLFANPRDWRRAIANGMAVDHSWEGRFSQYVDLYGRVARRPR